MLNYLGNKLNHIYYLGHEKLIFCFSGTFFKKRMRLCDFIYIAFNNKNIFENSKMKYSSYVL